MSENELTTLLRNLEPTNAGVEVAGVKVTVDKTDTWETIGMILVLVLAVYAGIKLINKISTKNPQSINKPEQGLPDPFPKQ